MESNLCDPVRIYVTVCACVVDYRIKCNLCVLCLPWLPLVPVHSLQPCGPAAGCLDVPACLGLPPSAGPALVSGRPSFPARVRSKHRSSIFPDLALAPRLPETFPDTFPPLVLLPHSAFTDLAVYLTVFQSTVTLGCSVARWAVYPLVAGLLLYVYDLGI